MSDLDFSGYITRPGPEIPRGYFQMEESSYHSYRAVSSGLLKSPSSADMLFSLTKPPVDSDEKAALVLGTLTHAACLEPWKFAKDNYQKYFAMCPTKGLDTKAAAEMREDPANAGKLLVTEELLTTAWRIRREGIETNPDALKFLNSPDGMCEATGVVWDPVHLCRRKWRVDYLPMKGAAYADYLLDIKTTRKPLHEFEREARRMGYVLQAALYMDSHELLTGHRVAYWRWLVVTNVEPYMSKMFFIRNLKPTDPLYNENAQLHQARQRLGLDASGKLGRLTQFLSSVREHEVARRDGVNLNHFTLRGMWPAYEQTDAVEIY